MFAQFTFFWKLDWSGLRSLAEKSLSKTFITAYNNVAYEWHAEFSVLNNFGNTVAFGLFNESGIDSDHACSYILDIVKQDYNVVSSYIGNPETWQVVARGNVDELQIKFNLIDSDAFRCKVTLKVPMQAFSCRYEFPFLEPAQTWTFNLFENIEQHSAFSNVKLVSRDGKIFYCHKSILEFQSEPMATMFRQPQSKREKKDFFDFPALGDDSMKALLQYFYTGLTTMDDLGIATVIELIDAAEQYCLENLKKAGAASLWKRIAENPAECVLVIQLADLHDDMKELKMRAMDLLLDEYDRKTTKEIFDLSAEFGGGKIGARLANEFMLYGSRRMAPCAILNT